MTTLTKFEATKDWQEITGVSEVNGIFTLQNSSSYKILLYLGVTPNDDDSFSISAKVGKKISEEKIYERIIDNSSNTEKVWARGDINNNNIAILKINKG